MAKASPFDFVKAVSQSNDDPVKAGSLNIADYNPWIVNKALMHRSDCIEAIQIVNTRSGMSKLGQYVVLRACIRKRAPRQDERWIKAPKSEDHEYLMEYFGVGPERAYEILDTIGEAGVLKIKESLGGEVKRSKK